MICHSPQPSSEGTAVLMTFNIPKDILGGGAEFNNPCDNRGGGGGDGSGGGKGGGAARFDNANNLLAPNSLHSKNVQQEKGSHGDADHPEKNSNNMELLDQKNINSTELVDRKKKTPGDIQLCNKRRPIKEVLGNDSAKRLVLDSSDIFH